MPKCDLAILAVTIQAFLAIAGCSDETCTDKCNQRSDDCLAAAGSLQERSDCLAVLDRCLNNECGLAVKMLAPPLPTASTGNGQPKILESTTWRPIDRKWRAYP